jgi:hypothetical protein
MPTPKGLLAGLTLGSAITGGALALCATAASADDPNNNGHVVSQVGQEESDEGRSAENIGFAAEETAEQFVEQIIEQSAENIGFAAEETAEQFVEQIIEQSAENIGFD